MSEGSTNKDSLIKQILFNTEKTERKQILVFEQAVRVAHLKELPQSLKLNDEIVC